MPIDVVAALSAPATISEYAWDADRVILYHLGVGAGVPPTAPGELEYVYESNLKVLPSFATIPPFGALAGVLTGPGMDLNLALLLHGEQDLVVHRALPVTATVENRARTAAVYDKGKGALIVAEITTSDNRGPLCTNRSSLFVRGEGGFGGDAGPLTGNLPPDRPADLVIESPTLPQQALLYRLTGDKNPLHVDPAFAALGGFDRPILHGLCTYGVVCKAVVDHILGGRVEQIRRYQARFAGIVYPGETILTSVWKEQSRFMVSATTAERGLPVIGNAALWVE